MHIAVTASFLLLCATGTLGIPTVGDLTPADPGRWEDGLFAPSCQGYRFPSPPYDPTTISGYYSIHTNGIRVTVECRLDGAEGGWTGVDAAVLDAGLPVVIAGDRGECYMEAGMPTAIGDGLLSCSFDVSLGFPISEVKLQALTMVALDGNILLKGSNDLWGHPDCDTGGGDVWMGTPAMQRASISLGGILGMPLDCIEGVPIEGGAGTMVPDGAAIVGRDNVLRIQMGQTKEPTGAVGMQWNSGKIWVKDGIGEVMTSPVPTTDTFANVDLIPMGTQTEVSGDAGTLLDGRGIIFQPETDLELTEVALFLDATMDTPIQLELWAITVPVGNVLDGAQAINSNGGDVPAGTAGWLWFPMPAILQGGQLYLLNARMDQSGSTLLYGFNEPGGLFADITIGSDVFIQLVDGTMGGDTADPFTPKLSVRVRRQQVATTTEEPSTVHSTAIETTKDTIALSTGGTTGATVVLPTGGTTTGATTAPVCDPPCLNGGECIDVNKCMCDPTSGYEGVTCQTPTCVEECVDGQCVAPNTCDCKSGLRCIDTGKCVSSVMECQPSLQCDCPTPFQCTLTDSCLSSSGECTSAGCPLTSTQCWDGQCKSEPSQCSPVPACPACTPKRCFDGSCVTADTVCGGVNPCGTGFATCINGTCVTNESLCLPYDGCPLSAPIQCHSGLCVNDNQECNCVINGQQGVYCSNGGIFVCLPTTQTCTPPPYTEKPLPVEVSISSNQTTQFSVKSKISGVQLASIYIPVGAFGSNAVLSVNGVPDSILSAALPPSSITQEPGTSSPLPYWIASAALDITVSTNVKQPFNDKIELCFKVTAASDPNTSTCLAYIDNNSGKWECEDEDLRSSDGLLCGTTDHFTNFAVLFVGTENEELGSSDSTEIKDSGMSGGITIAVIVVCVVAVVAVIVAIVIYQVRLSNKKKGFGKRAASLTAVQMEESNP